MKNWIAVDWGTTHLRAYLMGEAGILAEVSSADGMATLTRSITLGFLPIVAIWLLLRSRTAQEPTPPRLPAARRHRPVLVLACFLAGVMLTIGPWTIYNSRMYGGPVLIDTSGAFNLLLGARTAYDGKRSDAQVRNYVLGLLGQPTSETVGETCADYPGPLSSQAARPVQSASVERSRAMPWRA